MKIRIICIISILAFGTIVAKIGNSNDSFNPKKESHAGDRISRDLKFFFEKDECGKIIVSPDRGYQIIVPYRHLPDEKRENPTNNQHSPVTYGLSGGRLGDNLLSYLHARWIAYRHHVPLIFKPFPMADEFALAHDSLSTFDGPAQEIPYFPEPSMKNNNQPFEINWDDPGFREDILHCLAPTKPHTLLKLPSDRITLCVHVRRGGTFDSISLHSEYPLKFPPDNYYIEQIQTIAQLFHQKPLYVFIMTDDLHPNELVERYKKAIFHPNVQWDCRKSPPGSDLDDFFSIPLFDCMILCDSNFSIVASKLSEFVIKIAPTHYTKKKNAIRITGLDITFNPKQLKKDKLHVTKNRV